MHSEKNVLPLAISDCKLNYVKSRLPPNSDVFIQPEAQKYRHVFIIDT